MRTHEIRSYFRLHKREGIARNNMYQCCVTVHKNQDPGAEEWVNPKK